MRSVNALADERDQRPDAVVQRVEVIDPESVASEPRAGMRDRPQVLEVVAVAGMGNHDPSGIDTVAGHRVKGQQPRPLLGVGVDHHWSSGLDRCHRDRLDDPWYVAQEPVPLDRALEERGLHTGVIDALADLPDEQLRDRLLAAVREEVREFEERVHAGRDDDVDVGRLRHLADPRDVPAEPGAVGSTIVLIPASRTRVSFSTASATRSASSQ